jgi:lipopolysaccharide transport system permease protein
VASSVLLVLMLYYGIVPGASLIVLPLLVTGTMAAALGVGLLIAALNVTYRDFRYVVPFMLQIWLFLTPVIYPASMVPEPWRWLLLLNPMTGLIEGYRAAFLNQPLDWVSLVSAFGIAGLALVIGVAYFRVTERSFADVV